MEPTQNFGNIYTVFHLKGTDLTSHAHTSYRSACYAAAESCAEGVRLPFEVTEVWLVKSPRLGAAPSKSIIPSKNSPGHSSGRCPPKYPQPSTSIFFARRMEASSLFKLSESLRLTSSSQWS